MNARDVMIRMCALQARAAAHVGYQYAADCFCGQGGFWNEVGKRGTWEGGYRNDGKALEFIEEAVREKIAREFAPTNRENA